MLPLVMLIALGVGGAAAAVVRERRKGVIATGIPPIRSYAVATPPPAPSRAQRNLSKFNQTMGKKPTDKDDAEAEAAIQRAIDKAKNDFAKLSASEKKKCAAAMNAQFKAQYGVDLGLTGDESWDEATKKVGAAMGAIGGAAACAATGVGATVAGFCGAAGAVIGGFLGKKLGDYIEDGYDWAKDKAEDGVDWAKDKAVSAWHAINPLD